MSLNECFLLLVSFSLSLAVSGVGIGTQLLYFVLNEFGRDIPMPEDVSVICCCCQVCRLSEGGLNFNWILFRYAHSVTLAST